MAGQLWGSMPTSLMDSDASLPIRWEGGALPDL